MKILNGIIEIKNIEKFLEYLNNISKKYKVAIQALDANKIAGERHIQFAVEKAIKSMDLGRNIANTLSLEILLYASGKRQINKALSIGVSRGKNNIALVVVGDSNNEDLAISELKKLIDEKPVIEYTENKKTAIMEFFDITKEEINAVGEEKIPELVLERVALVDVMK